MATSAKRKKSKDGPGEQLKSVGDRRRTVSTRPLKGFLATFGDERAAQPREESRALPTDREVATPRRKTRRGESSVGWMIPSRTQLTVRKASTGRGLFRRETASRRPPVKEEGQAGGPELHHRRLEDA